jgi:hypothetical protein
MAKFMILYNTTATASELMENATPEEMQASMAEWIEWRDEASKSFKVEFGLPLQVVSQVTPQGVVASPSQISGYSIADGESKEVLQALLKTHPHLQRPGSSIDLFEMLPMPGIKS